MKKKFLAVLLACMIAASVVPAVVSADGEQAVSGPSVSDDVSVGDTEVDFEDGEADGVIDTEEELRTAVAQEGSVITLGADITLKSTLNVANNVTIDGAGQFTISIADDVTWATDNSNKYMVVASSGVTVQNVTIDAENNASGCLQFYTATGGKIHNVTLTGAKQLGLNVNASTVTATGTITYTGNGWGNGINVGWGSSISGASACSFDASGATLVGVSSIYTDTNDTTNAGEGTISITPPSSFARLSDPETVGKAAICVPSETVTATVDGTSYYASFEKAVEAAQPGATVTLNQDVTVNQAVNIDKNLVINGNGKVLTANKCVGLYIKKDIESLSVNNLTIKGVFDAGETAGEGGTGSFMGIGTYNGCYGVGKLELSDVTIDGFSYGLFFGKNPSGQAGPYNENPVRVNANNLTVQNCYIKGGYFEKLTDSSFTNCKFLNNGTNPEKVQAGFQTWLCGLDINLKNGVYQNISFNGCTFSGNGANRGTALHIKARNDGNYGAETRLTGVSVSGCTFTGNNAADTGASGAAFGPVVFGEPGKNNASPVGIAIQKGVTFTNNVADVNVVTFEGADAATQIVADGELILPAAPEKDGYTFKGWSDGTTTYDAGAGVTVSDDATFTAVWEENTEPEVPVDPEEPEEPEYPVLPELPDYVPEYGGNSGSSSKPETSKPETSEPETEWKRDDDGNTYFYKDGEKVTGWVEEDGEWYYMNEDTGAMTEESWVKVNNVWYAFDDDGHMLTGWQEIDGKWYYLKDWGGMATGWQQVDGVWYYLKGDGAMATGWVQSNGQWYYLKGNGAMATGWVESNGKWYYLYESGEMATNATIGGYYVNSNGEWVK